MGLASQHAEDRAAANRPVWLFPAATGAALIAMGRGTADRAAAWLDSPYIPIWKTSIIDRLAMLHLPAFSRAWGLLMARLNGNGSAGFIDRWRKPRKSAQQIARSRSFTPPTIPHLPSRYAQVLVSAIQAGRRSRRFVDTARYAARRRDVRLPRGLCETADGLLRCSFCASQ